jgi:hypothetical protein
MVELRATDLGRLEWKTSLHPRAAALSCPPPAIYGPGLLYDVSPGPRCALRRFFLPAVLGRLEWAVRLLAA